MAKEKFEVGLVFKAFDKVTGPLKKINSSLKGLKIQEFNRAFASFNKLSGINQLQGAFGRMGESMRSVGSQITSLGTKFLFFGGIATAALGKGVNSTIEWASKIHDLSEATGLSTESIQTIGFALRQAGGDQNDLEAGAKKFSIALTEARKKGAGPLVEALKKIDPQGLKEILNSKDTGQGLRIFINSLSKFKTDPGRFAAAFKVVGKSAAKSFAVLGKEGPEALKQAEKSITLFSKEQIDQLEATGDSAAGVFEQLKNIGRNFVFEAAPALKDFFDGLAESLGSNREKIREWAKEFGRDLPGILKDLKQTFTDLWKAMEPIRNFFKWVAADSDRLKVALIALAGIIVLPLIASIASLTASLVSLGVALVTTPIGQLSLALGATLLQFYLLYTELKKGAILVVSFFKDAIDPAKTFYELLVAIGDLFTGGPLRRFFSGEDPFAKFKEIKTRPIAFTNTKKVLNGIAKEQDEDWQLIKGIWNWKDVFKPAAPSPASAGAMASDSGMEKIQEMKEIAQISRSQTITKHSEITIRFENAPAGLKANVTRNEGNKIKVDLPLGLQTVGRPA